MTLYVIVGENTKLANISARAAYSTRALAEAHLASREAMWFDERAIIVKLELDRDFTQSYFERTGQ